MFLFIVINICGDCFLFRTQQDLPCTELNALFVVWLIFDYFVIKKELFVMRFTSFWHIYFNVIVTTIKNITQPSIASCKINRGKPVATTKSISPNRCYAARNIYRGEAGTTSESIIPNRCYAARNTYSGKACTAAESIRPNRCYAARNTYSSKACTTAESIRPNRCYAARNIYRGEAGTTSVFTTDYYSIFYR